MSTDHTQQQSFEEQRQARDLSLTRTQPPTEVPGYRIERFLGAGAYGEVWFATDQNTGRRVAIKFYLHRGGVDWQLLTREVKHLVSLSADRYVVQVLAVGWDADPPYYVMEYVENGSLEDLIDREGTLPAADAAELFHELSVGLVHSHGKGVLHCDLKPANILLDQDHLPRLADFGQSRLSDEQTPALGTLFYMAPEQANLEAVPDVRWDVYALGAIFYCMLTGSPPHRQEDITNKIDQATNLSERLHRYRDAIRNAARPTKHRRIPGVDRSMSDIIERCLEADPKRRFANAQEVLDALRNRDESRSRKPLMLLGIVGPILLLLVMALFGWRGYLEARDQSTKAITRRAYESNDYNAQFVASTLEAEIEHYFESVEREAIQPELLDILQNLTVANSLQKLHELEQETPDYVAARSDFLDSNEREPLKEYFDERLDSYLTNPQAPAFASMFVVDAHGIILSVAYDDKRVNTKSVGLNYAWRTYFHGGPDDLTDRSKQPPEVQHIRTTHLSSVFQSTTTKLWKVAISTPVYSEQHDEDTFLGVLVLTINVGDFEVLNKNDEESQQTDHEQTDRFAVLVDGRAGSSSFGTILHHPMFAEQKSDGEPHDYSGPKYRVTAKQFEQLASKIPFRYVDPLGWRSGDGELENAWIAASEPVRLPLRNDDDSPDKQETGLIVIMQENEQAATAPVRTLGGRLVYEGILALSVVLSVVFILWYFVLGVISKPRRTIQPTTATEYASTPVHEMPTMTSPKANE